MKPHIKDLIQICLLFGCVLTVPVVIGVSLVFSEIRSRDIQEARKKAVRELYPNLTDAQFEYFFDRGLLAAPKPVEAKP